jgi:hypothetical protein
MAKEYSELTLAPETNENKRGQPLERKVDRNIELYKKSKVHEKKNRTAEEIEFEKNQHELKFTPKINAGVPRAGKMLRDVKGVDTSAKRMSMGRE